MSELREELRRPENKSQPSSRSGREKSKKEEPKPKGIESLNFFDKIQRISLTDRAVFTQNLYIMVKSGVPLAQSLATLSEQTKSRRFSAVIYSMQQDIEKGDTFAKVLAKHGKFFSEVCISMVAAGEASGKLDKILSQLSLQLKKERMLMGKVKSAMTYPVIVVGAMVLIGIAMIVFVIPNITNIYKEVGADLPLATRLIIGTSDFIIANGLLVAVGAIGLLVALRFYLKSANGKRTFHAIILRTPIAGTIIKKINLARFSRTLQSLLQTDIPIVQSFQIIERTLGNIYYQKAMASAAESLKKGITVVEALKSYPRLFPPMVTQMISIGEESGKLDELASEIANFYEDDVDNTMSSFSSIIEPVLLLFLGVGVGAMAIAILLPMYTLTEQI